MPGGLHRSAVLPLAILLSTISTEVAAKRIVFLGFSGMGAGDATRLVGRALAGRHELVPRGRFFAEASRRGLSAGSYEGRSAAARGVGAVAVVSGSVDRARLRWTLRATIFSAATGRPVGSASVPLRGMRVDPASAQRLAAAINAAVARVRGGGAPPPVARAPSPGGRGRRHRVAVRPHPAPAPAPAPAPTPRPAPPPPPVAETPAPNPPVATNPPSVEGEEGVDEPSVPRSAPREESEEGQEGDSIGFDVEEGDDSSDRQTRPSRKRGRGGRRSSEATARARLGENERLEHEKIIELSLGFMLLSRSFRFNDPIDPKDPSDYKSGVVPAMQLDAAFYPAAYFGRNALANLGLVVSYYRVLSIRSRLASVGGEPKDTTLQQVEGGLRYRWNMLGRVTSPVLRAGLSVGLLSFNINWDDISGNPPLPNLSYLYLKLAVASLDIPFFQGRSFGMGATASFDYLQVFSAGDIEQPDSTGYGRSSTGGVDLGAGLYFTFPCLGGMYARLTGFYRWFFFAFDGGCSGCKQAGGALDVYAGGLLTLGYAY